MHSGKRGPLEGRRAPPLCARPGVLGTAPHVPRLSPPGRVCGTGRDLTVQPAGPRHLPEVSGRFQHTHRQQHAPHAGPEAEGGLPEEPGRADGQRRRPPLCKIKTTLCLTRTLSARRTDLLRGGLSLVLSSVPWPLGVLQSLAVTRGQERALLSQCLCWCRPRRVTRG